ncbi:unnamed protein product [Prunus armeniaca]
MRVVGRVDTTRLINGLGRYYSGLTRNSPYLFTNRRRLERLLGVELLMPSLQDPEHFCFWLASLSNRRPHERLDLLRLRDTRERIQCELRYLTAKEQGCQMQ